jgi:methylated-DNA-[protein]-cysteine S-methyltransferase
MKKKVIELLGSSNYDALSDIPHGKRGILIRHLVSLTYDKADVLCRRAIKAIGKLSASMPKESVRALVQKQLWMMRDESGGNPWSAPEIIGEIIIHNVESLPDIIPVLESFHDEEFFRPGVLRALNKIAEARPELVEPFADELSPYINSEDPEVRGNAVALLGALGLEKYLPSIKKKLSDDAVFSAFKDDIIVKIRIKDAAYRAIERIKSKNP